MEHRKKERRQLLRALQYGVLGAASMPFIAGRLVPSSADSIRSDAKVGFVASVFEFGVKGNGKDESVAIQAAINEVAAAGGGVIEFPPGTYACVGIELRPQVHLRGLRRQSYLRASGPGTILTIPPGTDRVDVVGLSFRGVRERRPSIGVVVHGINNRLFDCDFQEFADEGIVLAEGGLVHHLQYIFADNCLQFSPSKVTGALRVGAHDCTLFNVEIAGGLGTQLGTIHDPNNNSWCIYVTGANTFMTDCVAEVGHGGIRFAQSAQQSRVENTRSDLHSRHGWLIECSRSQFSNCIALNCGLGGSTATDPPLGWPGWWVAGAAHNTFTNCRQHHEEYGGNTTYGFEESGEEPGRLGNHACNNFIACTSLGHSIAPFLTTSAGPLHGNNRHYVAEWLNSSDNIDVINIGILELRYVAHSAISNFTGTDGQRLVLLGASKDASVTVKNSESIRTKSGMDIEIRHNMTCEFINIRHIWYQLA